VFTPVGGGRRCQRRKVGPTGGVVHEKKGCACQTSKEKSNSKVRLIIRIERWDIGKGATKGERRAQGRNKNRTKEVGETMKTSRRKSDVFQKKRGWGDRDLRLWEAGEPGEDSRNKKGREEYVYGDPKKRG